MIMHLVPCHICKADKVSLMWHECGDKSLFHYAHCASCGMETGRFSSAEQVVKHWNENLPPEKVFLHFGTNGFQFTNPITTGD